MKTVKLVGLDTYIGPTSGNEVVLRGQVLTIADDKEAARLLDLVTTDALGNDHPYFEEVGEREVGDDSSKKAARSTRARSKAAAGPDEEA